MAQQVRFPLKLKLLSVMLVLISASLSVFVIIALKTFREDKAATIFETLLSKATSGQVLLANELKGSSLKVEGDRVTSNGAPADELLRKALQEDSSYLHKIVIPQQDSFYEWHDGKVTRVEGDLRELYARMTGASVNQAVNEVKQGKEKWLYAYDYTPVNNFAFVVALPQKEAFSAATYLINRSLLWGLFILGASLILSVLLARPLTAGLETVHDLTREIASGNFHKRIQMKGHDEVTALGESVNHMAGEIERYMEEMKEKARLENEVAVAQLVQSSFFPPSRLDDESVQISGRFEAATECGGDWWGVFDAGDWKTIFIADATGHGVPAALLTATMNCCKSSLSFILEQRGDLLSKPEEILRYMNQAVLGAGNSIQVTCFVATFNKKTRELHYANASQTPPLLWSSVKAGLNKEDFRPLMDPNGPRLGQTASALYKSETTRLEAGDTMLFYTDGLTEAENAEGQQWGQRRLLKTLIQHGNSSADELVETLLQELKTFSPTRPKDDITVVSMRVLHESERGRVRERNSDLRPA